MALVFWLLFTMVIGPLIIFGIALLLSEFF